MNINNLFSKFLFVIILCAVSIVSHAQPFLQEKRIYLVDVTASMEGKGSVPTPNIFSTVKSNLSSTINNIEDPNTEIVIIPFTTQPIDEYSGHVGQKDSLLSIIDNIQISHGDTNIADAWSKGVSCLDSTKINYLFLLTDGLHNYGPTKEELYARLSEWKDISNDKYMFAFYVMLTPNARELEICDIVEETKNLWIISSMDIDACLIKSSNLLKKNIYEDPSATISFTTNNKHVAIDEIGLAIDLEDNPYYEIRKQKIYTDANSIQFEIKEKTEKLNIPLTDTLTLKISHDSENYPFVFFTPEELQFVISNQGLRTATISDRKMNGRALDIINFKQIKFKEPFRGPFKYVRKYLEYTLDYVPFKWFKPDTTYISKDLFISFNEEAVRASSKIYFSMRGADGEVVNYIRSNADSVINASDNGRKVNLLVCFLPNSNSKQLQGRIISVSENIDKINNNDSSTGIDQIGTWKAKYKRPWPIVLWLLWIFAAIILLALIILVVYLLIKLLPLVSLKLFKTHVYLIYAQ